MFNIFLACTSLESISLPSTLEYVGQTVFYDCSSLKECILPPTVHDIYNAFEGCTSLESFILPASMTHSVWDYTFYRCKSLKAVVFPAGVTNIRVHAFSGTADKVEVYNFASCLQDHSEGPTGLYPSYIHVPVGWQNSSSYPSLSGTLVYDLESISSIQISNEYLILTEGETSTLSCTILPSTASVKTLHWASNNTDVAIVDNDGKVTAINAGSAIITALSLDGSNLSQTCVVTVEHAPVYATSIEVDKTDISLGIGATTKLTANITPSNVDNSTVVWSSSNSNVASVNTNGVVTAISVGEANIVATTTDGSNLSASCKVTVEEANYLEIVNTEVLKGRQITLPVNMNNTEDITALQFDLTLPAGVSIAKNTQGKYIVEKTGRCADHTLNVSKPGDANVYKVLLYITPVENITGSEGAVLNVTLETSESMAEGDYEVTISNINLTTPDETKITPADVTCKLTVTNSIPGDANGDGSIDVTDIVSIANAILGRPSSSFDATAADVNGDGSIDVTDIVVIANMILRGNGQNNAKMRGGDEDDEEDMLDPQ